MGHCPFCGSELIKDEPTGLYECKACDVIFTVNNDEIKYLNNASIILEQIWNDLKLMNK